MAFVLDIPDPELVPAGLQPRRVLHDGTEIDGLASRVSVGLPVVVRLTPDLLDSETASFVRADESSAYYLVRLVLSFYPSEKVPVIAADVALLLSHEGPATAAAPTTWSMTPTEVRTGIPDATSVKLTGNLGFVKGEIQTPAKRGEEPFLLALGEGQSNPEWRFRATSLYEEIVGIHRLTAVVRAPVDVRCHGALVVAATVMKRRAGVLRCRAKLSPDVASVRFPASSL